MSHPVLFPIHYCFNKASLFTYRGQYFFICLFIFPAHLLHSSPQPHLQSIQLISYFFFHCPRFTTIQCYRPHQCLDHPLLSSLFRRFVTSSFILPKACFAIPILALTSSIHVPFSVITAPRYLNVATCSTF